MAAWLCGRPRRLCGLGGEVGDGNHGRGKGAAVILARLQSGIMGELAKIASKVRRCETERRAYGVLGVTAGIGVDAANVGTGSLKKGVVAMLPEGRPMASDEDSDGDTGCAEGNTDGSVYV